MAGDSGTGRTGPGVRTQTSETGRGRTPAGPHPRPSPGLRVSPAPRGGQEERSAAPETRPTAHPGRPRGPPGAAPPAHGELAPVRPGRKFARRRPQGLSGPSGAGEGRAARGCLLPSGLGPGFWAGLPPLY